MKTSQLSRWLVIGFLAAGIFGWSATGQLAYARLVYLTVILVLGSFLWSYVAARGLSLKRSARTMRATVGDVFEERFDIAVQAWTGAVWLEVLNRSSIPQAAGSRLLTMIGPRQRRFYTARTLLSRRGAFPLGPTSLTLGDPFGLFPVTRTVEAEGTLVVLPMSFPIAEFPPPPGILPGGKTIRARTVDVTPHSAGVREYVPGDPMKRIHWPSTARRNRFMVKEFEQDPQADIWIFLDGQRGSHFALPDTAANAVDEGLWLWRPKIEMAPDSFEYAVSAAASLAQYFLADRRSVGLAANTSRMSVLSAERGVRQTTKVMETLAFLQADGELPLLSLVTTQAKLLQIGTGVILVTSSHSDDIFLAVEYLQRRSLRPLVVLIRPETFGGRGDSEKIAAGLLGREIPACLVGLGDDLTSKLTLPVVYFQRSRYSKSNFAVPG
jgi:uncharacterized protein (DUF58 family)